MAHHKTALVTGCSSGIGYSLAKELASRGWKVYACARRLKLMQSLVEEYPDNIHIFTMDVGSVTSIDKGYEYVSTRLPDGKLDLLYNNAGSSCTFPAIDVPDKALSQCVSVDFEGPVRITHKFSRLVIKAQGTIAFTGSLAGVMPFPWGSVYGSMKAAIHQYASILALEMEPFNVKVVNFVTGGVKTNIADTRGLPEDSIYNIPATKKSFADRQKMAVKNHPMEPNAYAKKAVDAIESSRVGKVNVYLGTGARSLSFLNNFIPRFIILLVIRIKFGLLAVWASLYKEKEE